MYDLESEDSTLVEAVGGRLRDIYEQKLEPLDLASILEESKTKLIDEYVDEVAEKATDETRTPNVKRSTRRRRKVQRKEEDSKGAFQSFG